jgi:hypothetical protein
MSRSFSSKWLAVVTSVFLRLSPVFPEKYWVITIKNTTIVPFQIHTYSDQLNFLSMACDVCTWNNFPKETKITFWLWFNLTYTLILVVENKNVSTYVAIFWDIAPFSPYVNRRFGGKYHLHLKLPSHLLHAGFWLGRFSALKMEVIRSTETSVYIQTARRYIPEDDSINNYRCDTLIPYIRM